MFSFSFATFDAVAPHAIAAFGDLFDNAMRPAGHAVGDHQRIAGMPADGDGGAFERELHPAVAGVDFEVRSFHGNTTTMIPSPGIL